MSVKGQEMGASWVDHSVDVPLLMSHPKSALLGILQLLKGWETVRKLPRCLLSLIITQPQGLTTIIQRFCLCKYW